MKIIRPGVNKNEMILRCYKCTCEFLFEFSELTGVQRQGGYIQCPHCKEMHFITLPVHYVIGGDK